MSEEKKDKIIEKRESIFADMQKRHEFLWNQLGEMDKMFDWMGQNVMQQPVVIKMDDVETFKSSIEKFQENNPKAKIKAQAYVYSTGVSPQMFKYESKEEKPKLEEKEIKPLKKSKKKKQ